jgi:hypothetical protein
MLKDVFFYFWACLLVAIRGSLSSALNWASIVGVGIVGAYLERRGSPMSDPHTWQGIVWWGVIYTTAAWIIIFSLRLIFVAPFHLFYEQKAKADKFDGLNQVASGAKRRPSFAIGFDCPDLDQEKIAAFIEESSFPWQRSSFVRFDDQDVCRIWVENLESRPVFDCRLVIENFYPRSPVKNGVMLIADNRGADDEKGAAFHLAATERRYFKFLLLTKPIASEQLAVSIKSDQDRTGIAGVFDDSELEFNTEYFATIAAHGRDAFSRRINLTIKPISANEIAVCETVATDKRELQATNQEVGL